MNFVIKKIENTEKFGLKYELKATKKTLSKTNLICLFSLNLRKQKMLIEKKMRPNNLLSGQIDKLLNVGDKKINAANNNKIFSSISLNFNFKHLKKINGKNKHM